MACEATSVGTQRPSVVVEESVVWRLAVTYSQRTSRAVSATPAIGLPVGVTATAVPLTRAPLSTNERSSRTPT